MRIALFYIALCITSITFAESTPKPKVTISHSIALHGESEYKEGFKHWNYVNPNAPQGGYVTFASRGTFDSFNRFSSRGRTPANVSPFLYDTLMTDNLDEEGVVYGLIAEKVEYPDTHDWVIFHLDPKATFQDGHPIEASDVVFTFNKFMEQGVSQFRSYFANVKPEILGPQKVKFTLPNPDFSKLFALCSTTVFPEHKPFNLEDPLNTPPLGSGAYKISDFKMGEYVEYQKHENYWAKNHPTAVGTNNFHKVRYEYYLDESVQFEAFKKGEYDFRSEDTAKRWETQYTGPNFDKDFIIKEAIPNELPGEMTGFVFNVQRKQFKNPKVREAIALLYNFEWSNKNLFFGAYKRNTSYFRNTPYQATGLPQGNELALLNQYKEFLPKEAFTSEFTIPKTDGSGNVRPQLRQALKLFKQAGYKNVNGKMIHTQTGEALKFEFLIPTPAYELIGNPLKENLAKAGIEMSIRLIDITRYQNRLRKRDYDMVYSGLAGGSHPSPYITLEWHSGYLDSSYNASGATSKALDDLTQGILDNQLDEQKLLTYGRALDRLLLWNHYIIPSHHLPEYRISYWDRFSRPDVLPKYDYGFFTWWIDKEKDKKLPTRNARSN